MRLVFAGTPEVALPSLDALAASGHELVGVVTRPDAPAGRGRKLVASPVAQRAEELGLPVLKPDHPRKPDFQEALRALGPDCCPVVAYGAMLPQSALDIPPLGWVNLHFSCLPAWRGAAPVQHAIWAGDEVTGATTFRIVKELDAGPAFGVMTERIRPDDTAGDLLGRLAEGGAGLLVATIDGLADGSLVAREQEADGVSFAPKISVEDARVDWDVPAHLLERQVRACTPAPGAWSLHDGERLKLGTVLVVDEQLPPGVLEVRKSHVLVGTATYAVLLGQVQPFGKRRMAAADWARGARLESGARLGDTAGRDEPSV
jgi:methionyl-tRNA formyltransferase